MVRVEISQVVEEEAQYAAVANGEERDRSKLRLKAVSGTFNNSSEMVKRKMKVAPVDIFVY